jgi:integrase
MASISQRGSSWRAEVYRRGKRMTGTFDTEEEAAAWAERTEALLNGPATVAQIRKAPLSMTCADLFDRYSQEVSPGKRGSRWEIIRLRALGRDQAFAGTPASELDGATLAEWRDRRLGVVQASTVNRDLNLISAIYTRSIKEWRLPIATNPVRDLMRPPHPRHRTRRVSDEERDAIVKQLGWDGVSSPADLLELTAWAFRFALETGMRQGEVLGMAWLHVHARHVHLPQTKNGDPRDVPLSSAARALLGLLARDDVRVVPLEAGTCGAYFREACRGACVDDLHFHDARHEAATRFAGRLSPLELARVLGHRDLRSVMTYFNPHAGELADRLG